MAFDWKSALGTVAPWLAGTLAGPAAGLAVKSLCSLAGLEPTLENAQKVAEQAASGTLTGDQFLKLRELEAQHEKEMQAMGYQNLADLERIAYQDRDSARNREIKTGDRTAAILAYGISAGFFVLLGFLAKFSPPEGSRDVLNIMLGSLGGAFVSIVSYYFGSSASSARSAETIKAVVTEKKATR